MFNLTPDPLLLTTSMLSLRKKDDKNDLISAINVRILRQCLRDGPDVLNEGGRNICSQRNKDEAVDWKKKKRADTYKIHIRLEEEPCYGLTKEFLSIIRCPTEFGTLAVVIAPSMWLCNFLQHFSETQRQNQESRSLIHSRGPDKGLRGAVKVLRELRLTVRIVGIIH